MGWQPCEVCEKNIMTKQLFFAKVLAFFFVVAAVRSVVSAIQFESNLTLGNTAFWWFYQTCFLLLALVSIKYFVAKKQSALMKLIQFYILLVLINFMRGLLISDTYWDFKGLINNSLPLLVPVLAYLGTNKDLVKRLLTTYFKYGLVVLVALLPILPKVAFGYYLVPVTLITLFYSALSIKTKALMIALILIVFTADLGARSNVIKFFVPLCLCFIFYFKNILGTKSLNFIRITFFFLPPILLTLAIQGDFNVFKMEDYIKGSFTTLKLDEDGHEKEENLLSDTRTFLYVEALSTSEYYNSWIFGRSPARGTISAHFGHEDLNNRGERLSNEVSILNIYTWLGLVGVLVYAFIFYFASYYAINKSNNYYCQILGVFIAFRWCYAWVEDFTIFSLTYILLWIMIGMCYSVQFREMTDLEFKVWVKSIFNGKLKSYSAKA
ncbi:hypothetical protein FE810_09045 [Thalassotalea litorea]|uniref:O-antigen ligase family protein n=1 Tax=Thalassotalea litorea TaxID=2020715 RepID=A0A5R9IKS1_9GAMM|nr:hypothetical protein [Thalassotalea litorea]TLU65063.1 hypothetical protein FE810_09045 [Thalassotalea litorea]